MGSFSIWHWLIVLVVVVLLFGTKKLGNVGSDLSSAIKNFRKGLQDDDKPGADKLEAARREDAQPAREESRDRSE